MRPLIQLGFDVAGVVRRTVTNFVDQEGVQWSGAVAFYLMLSVPPLLVAGASVAITLVGAETARSFITEQAVQFVPARRDAIEEIVDRTVGVSGPAGMAALAFLLFSGSRVFASLIAAINLMWDEVSPAGFIRTQLKRIVLVFSAGGLLAAAGIIDLAFAAIGDVVEPPAPLRYVAQSQLVPIALAAAALFVLFVLVPRRAATWQTAAIGALVGAAGLRAAQWLFTGYLASFANFETAYGPVAQLAVVMTWALIASAVVLLAAHLVAVLNTDQGSDDELRQRAPGEAQASRRRRPDPSRPT